MTAVKNIKTGIGYYLRRCALLVLRWTYVRSAYSVTLQEENGGKTEIRYYDQSFEEALSRYGIEFRYKTEIHLKKGSFRSAMPRFLPFRWYFHMEIGMPWPRYKAGGLRGAASNEKKDTAAEAEEQTRETSVQRKAVSAPKGRTIGNKEGGQTAKREEEAIPALLSLDMLEQASREYMQTRDLLINNK